MNPEAPVMTRRGSGIGHHCTHTCPQYPDGVPESGSPRGYTPRVHEMGIAIEVYRTCRDAVREHGGGRLRNVRLAVGELAAVEPDLLEFAWHAVVAEGPDAEAVLEIDFCPALQHCPACDTDADRSEGSWLRLCPACGMPLEVSGGDELDVLEVSFTDEQEVTR